MFFSFLQNVIIWQLFLLQGADCRGHLFILPGQGHTMHKLFVLLILLNDALISIEQKLQLQVTLRDQRLKMDAVYIEWCISLVIFFLLLLFHRSD